MTLELLIIKIIHDYQAYKRDCRKDDDALVKQKIIDELASLRTMMVQFTNEPACNDTTLFKEMKTVRDKVDSFIQEVEYSLSGHSYPFFSSQTSVGSIQLKKIMNYDLSILEKTNDLVFSFQELQRQYLDQDQNSIKQEFRRFNQKITEVRNEFQKRNELIKKM